ncbi:hypothetical protein EDB19DRAFT_1829764 [Suillus lakei]|nr:hypothetical protein EDB19DRAFT_1829764 [Suillus lakei]
MNRLGMVPEHPEVDNNEICQGGSKGCAMPYPLQVNHRYVWDLFVDGALGNSKHTPSGLPSTPGDVLGPATRLPDMRFNNSQVFQTRHDVTNIGHSTDTDPRKGEGNTGTVKNKLEERAKMLVAIINSARVTPLKMVTNMFASGGIPPGYWWPNISLLEVFEWDVGEKPTSYLNIPSSKEFGGH